MSKKVLLKEFLRVFGFTVVFISALFVVLLYDLMTGKSSQTTEYCAINGVLSVAWILEIKYKIYSKSGLIPRYNNNVLLRLVVVIMVDNENLNKIHKSKMLL